MKKILIIIVALGLVAALTLGLATTVFAQDAELVGELADGARPYHGYAGRIISLQGDIVTFKRGSGWTVEITVGDETDYSINCENSTAEEFKAYVSEVLAQDEIIRAVARAGESADEKIVADSIKIIPMLIVGEVRSVSDVEMILEMKDGEMAISLTEDTRYGIPGQGEVNAA